VVNHLFQEVIQKASASVRRVVGVVDNTYIVAACSDVRKVDATLDGREINGIFYSGNAHSVSGITYKAFGEDPRKFDFAFFVQGDDEHAKFCCDMLAASFGTILELYDEKREKAAFIRNVLLDNILPGDIYIKSREFRLDSELERVALYVKAEEAKEADLAELVLSLFPDRSRDFVITIRAGEVALVKDLTETNEMCHIRAMAEAMRAMLIETFGEVYVGVGTIVQGVRDLSSSFKEAQIALEVSKVFEMGGTVVTYENLGIARLIYQLPTTLCGMFLREVFKKGGVEILDDETVFTIRAFFENSLNVSEASRKLFIHRNTLVYRLDKVEKLTGLDLRKFEDAIVFKVALMVSKYLEFTNSRSRY
jgi:carbohydrate diacid regulator